MNIDFNLFGIIGIKLIDPKELHVRNVSKILGIDPSELDREPDIKIRFVNKIDCGNLNYAGLEAAFDENNFYLLNRNKNHSKVLIPFEKIGNHCEIICEIENSEIPLLNYIIYLSFLSKKWIAVHSSSFSVDHNGTLIMGWTKGGKTETMLAFLNHGAQFVSDEWTVISENGKSLHSLPVEITIWEWYFNEIKNILPKIKTQKKIIFALIHFFQIITNLYLKLGIQNSELSNILNRVTARAKKNLNIRILPDKLINVDISKGTVTLKNIIFSVSTSQRDIAIYKCSVDEVIERMIQSNREEYHSLFEIYRTFRFAFPDRKNQLLEKFDEIHRAIFTYCFEGKNIYKLDHPYPVPLNQLYTIVQKEISNI